MSEVNPKVIPIKPGTPGFVSKLVPPHLTLGNPTYDAAGLSYATCKKATEALFELDVFVHMVANLYKLCEGLPLEGQEAVFESIGKDAAECLLLMQYRKKLKTTELGDMTEAFKTAAAL